MIKKENKFDINEFFQIKKAISECDTFYEAMFNLTNISYSDDISTACISFDKQGNALNMKINYDFWQSLNINGKTFVILHELYHTIYDHGKRFIKLGADFKLANIASDIVINHHIHEKIGLNRQLFDWKNYYWVETAFPGEVVDTNKSCEYYYNKLKKQKTLQEKQLLGSHNDGDNNELEENQTDNNNEKSNSKDKLKHDNFSSEDLSDDIKDILEQNPVLWKNLDKQLKQDIKNKFTIKPPSTNETHDGREQIYDKNQEILNYDKLINLLIPKKAKMQTNFVESWVGNHRRYTSFLKLNPNIRLPNTLEVDKKMPKTKKEVWIFIDCSSSCSHMVQPFHNIVFNMMKNKEINCRSFAFGDNCKEINLKDEQVTFYSGNAGGFDCIESKILNLIKKEKINYPDNIVVLSDGEVHFNNKNNVLKPENWIMLLSNPNNKYLTPPGGKFFHMDESFFSTNKKLKM